VIWFSIKYFHSFIIGGHAYFVAYPKAWNSIPQFFKGN